MTVIFEGTLAELQQRMLTFPFPPEERVSLVIREEAAPGERAAQSPIAEPEISQILDRGKEMAEDDDEYFLRFYRPA